MNRTAIAVVTAVLIALPTIGAAEKKIDVGKREFDANCAVCHGLQGRGDGPLAGLIEQHAANLTVLAKNNGGVFPLTRVYEYIEGQKATKAHGTRDMPIWGREYQIKAAEYYVDVPYDAESYVRARILALAEYINRLQQN